VPASVIRLREADGSLVVVGSAGRTRFPFGPGHRLPPGSGVAGQAIAEGRPVIGDPLAPALAMRMTADFRLRIERSGIRTVLAVPLRVAETVLGVLSVGDEEGRAFSAADVALIQTFADQAAVALTNARFFQEGERRRRAAEGLAELGQQLTRSLDAGEVSRQIVDTVLRLLGTSGAALYRVEPETQNLVTLAFAGVSEPSFRQRAATLPPGVGVVGRAVRERRPVWTPDILADPNFTLTPDLQTHFAQSEIRALLGVPLLVQGRVIGALGTGTRVGRVFDGEDIRLAQAFADRAIIALENSRLYGDLQTTLAELERSYEQAFRARAGIVHDVNNRLTAALGHAERLLRDASDPDVARGLEIIRRATLDAGDALRRLLP